MLESLTQKKTDVVVRKVDINRPDVQGIDRDSPAGQQTAGGIPYFEIYDQDGKQVAKGFYQGTDMLMEWCNEVGIGEDDLRKAGVIK